MENESFSPIVACAFTINYIIGSGFLLLPWVFSRAGIILSVLSLSFLAFLSILAVCFIINSTYILTKISQHQKVNYNHEDPLLLKSSKSNKSTKSTKASNYGYEAINTIIESGSAKVFIEHTEIESPIHFKYYEIIELCSIYLGWIGKIGYAISLLLYMIGTLWAYSTVFGKAISTMSCMKYISYEVILCIFFMIVVPLSLMELTEQESLQVILAFCRFLMLFLMIATVCISMIYDIQSFSDTLPPTSQYGSFEELPLFNLHYAHILLPVAAYANIFHHSIPALASPIKNQNTVIPIFTVTVILVLIFYVLAGSVVSYYFRSHVFPASNLNWNNYIGYIPSSTIIDHTQINTEDIPLYAQIISGFIVIFPAFDVMSAYPLNAITLGNNMYSLYYEYLVYSDPMNPLYKNKDAYLHNTKLYIIRKLFRFFASAPPIIGASIMSDLGKITDYTGITGFAIGFIFPALLAIMAEKKCHDLNITSTTPYTHYLTGYIYQYLSVFVGVFLCIYVFCNLITEK